MNRRSTRECWAAQRAHTVLGAALAGALALSGTAAAQLSAIGLQYTATYLQTSAAAPTTTTSHQVSASFSLPTGGEVSVDEAFVQRPSGAEVEVGGSGSPGLYVSDTFTYPTREALMGAWPSGAYEFRIVTLDEDENYVESFYTLQQPVAAGAWPLTIPAFTPATYAALQGMNPALPRTVEVNAFAVTPPANEQLNGLTISQRFGAFPIPGPTVWSSLTLVNPPNPTRTIPAGALQPNTEYWATWTFSQRVVMVPDPPGVGYARSSFVNQTRVAFTTGAANACAADLGSTGGVPGPDGVLDNNDFVVFIDWFFRGDLRADVGSAGGAPNPDGVLDNNDFIVFIDRFFTGC